MMHFLISVIYIAIYMAAGALFSALFDMPYEDTVTFLTLGAVCAILADSNRKGGRN